MAVRIPTSPSSTDVAAPPTKLRRVSRPTVRIEMVAASLFVPPSPVRPLDRSLLFPPERHCRPRTTRSPNSAPPPRPASAPPSTAAFAPPVPDPRKTQTPLSRSFAEHTRGSSFSEKGQLLRPPPPLFRPTTFWRNHPKSGVTGASYSPSTHLVRRATFLAAGLALDSPVADLSALCVESRVRTVFLPPASTF